MKSPRFGLNRFDSRSVDAFAADVRRAEQLGWDAALQDAVPAGAAAGERYPGPAMKSVYI